MRGDRRPEDIAPSERELEDAKTAASAQQNGGSIGGALGTAGGAIIGTLLGPGIGTAAGAALGGTIGSAAGNFIGGQIANGASDELQHAAAIRARKLADFQLKQRALDQLLAEH